MESKNSFLPTPIEVTVNGETLAIMPFPFGKLHIVAAKLAPVFSAFQGLQAGDQVDYADVIEAGGENLQDVLALAAGKPRQWMDSIYDYEEGKALAMAVFDANKDVLLKKVVPDLLKTMQKAPAKAEA